LERLDDAHERLASYNTDSRWPQTENLARRFHDYASALLCMVFLPRLSYEPERA
jgi:hypothetical protein